MAALAELATAAREGSARAFVQKKEGERAGKARADSLPRRGARAAVLVAGDAAAAEIIGGVELGTVAAMAARGSSTRGGGCCPRVLRGGLGALGKAFMGPGNIGVRAREGSSGGGAAPRDAEGGWGRV